MEAVQRLRQSQFLRQNTIFFLGSVAVGVLNYLYYPIIGRIMTPAAFGEVQTLISLFLQLTIFLTVFSLVVVNIVANVTDAGRRDKLVLEFEKLALLVSTMLLIATIVLQPFLKEFFQFSSSWPFVILALAMVATVPYTMRSAFLRGKQRFGLAALSNLVGAGGKILFSVLLVTIGLGAAGAIGGLVLAQILACTLVMWWAYRNGLISNAHRFSLPDIRLLLPELKYGLLVLVSLLAITLQYSVDVVIIKHFFDAHQAGLYAGIASVARIIFFLTASVALVLMPSVKINNPPERNRNLLYKSLILLGGLSLPVLALFVLAPQFIVGLLMGHSYTQMAHVLPLLGIAMCLVSVLNLFVAYYLALRRWGIAAVVSLGALITYVLILANRESVTGIVNGLLLGSIVMLGLLGLWLRIFSKERRAKVS